MARRKIINKQFWYIASSLIFLAVLVTLIIGGSLGWFKFIINMPGQSIIVQNITQSPVAQQPVYSSCSKVCEAEGFSQFYNYVTSCNAGETKVTYGYPNQAPLLTCCCYNEVPVEPSIECTDSDGDNKDTVGHVTADGNTYYDRCLEAGQGVTEYVCVNSRMSSTNYLCDVGEICMQTRSGGHCIPSPTIWHPGDVVFSGDGSGIIEGNTAPIGDTLDLSKYKLTPGGTCTLGVRIQTSWAYATGTICTGLQGNEGLIWNFYDSSGLEYSRVDAVPIGVGVDLHPTAHNFEWDGTTLWHGEVRKMLGIPECIVNYEYHVEIYIYSC